MPRAEPEAAALLRRAPMNCSKWFAWWGFLLVLSAVHAAPPHLDLEVTLDPGTRKFQAKADLTTDAGKTDAALDPMFQVSHVSVDGVKLRNASGVNAALRPQASDAPRRLVMEYSGTLPALPEGQQRNSPNPARVFAAPVGSYLSAAAGWYPDPGVPFTYKLRLSLPAGQKALAPGKQVRQHESGGRYVAEYDFPYPAEGIWIMAGPYQVAQQSLVLEDGKPVTVRTWFHPELSSLANDYLQDSVRYIQRYSRLVGTYPFGDFSIVSSPLSHGLGIPSLTYLGRDVLRLPFIRATSLGHEVLHNWWGNAVYPDWSSGNWSEGLTTFMADYAFREDQSEQAAREMRLNWLRDLAAVAAPDETSLLDFKSRHHGISSVIGYGKSAMVFYMLRDEIGRPAFEQGLRLFWQRYQFKTATWKDLQGVFAQASGRDLAAFFTQWTARASSPQLLLAPTQAPAQTGGMRLLQQGDVFDLLVPLRVRMASGETHEIKLRVRDRDSVVDLASFSIPPGAKEVELDPELRLWRRLDPRLVPPIFRDTFIAPRAEVFLANKSPEWTAPAMALAGRLLDSQPRQVSESELLASPLPAVVVGDRAGVTRVLSGLGLGGLPDVLFQENAAGALDPKPIKGSAQAWTARAKNGKTVAFVMTEKAEALATLQRSMPHYGRQSWLLFQDGRVVGQGAWPVHAQALSLQGTGR
jgi:aminopeptidase N